MDGSTVKGLLQDEAVVDKIIDTGRIFFTSSDFTVNVFPLLLYTFVSLLLRMSSYQQAGLTFANLKLPLNMLFALTEGERIVSKRDSKSPLYTGRPDHHISAHPPRRGLHIL